MDDSVFKTTNEMRSVENNAIKLKHDNNNEERSVENLHQSDHIREI